jgi:protein-S-isoprenylcysteine O-methyltransferase Ste14
MLHTLRFSLLHSIYFIMLLFLVLVLFTFYIQGVLKFKICKSVDHRTIQINHQPDATTFQFIILTFVYRSTCFGRFPAHHQEHNDCSGSLWFYLRIVVIVMTCSTATAVIKLLMMGGKTPETCWVVNKRRDNKLKNCCIRLVIYLN